MVLLLFYIKLVLLALVTVDNWTRGVSHFQMDENLFRKIAYANIHPSLKNVKGKIEQNCMFFACRKKQGKTRGQARRFRHLLYMPLRTQSHAHRPRFP
jgi:hypothetical protein